MAGRHDEIHAVDDAVQTAAIARYRAGTSFVDMVSIEFMARVAIDTAFVFDTDFATAGITVMPPTGPSAS